MKRLLIALLALLAAWPAAAPATAPGDRYAEGQVWEYKTRPQDAGSLLRIQRIEDGGKLGTIYHINLIGIVLGNKGPTVIQHLPVSKATLDASVIRLSDAKRDWPDATAGIAQWRAAQGGVFDIPISEIVATVEKAVSGNNAPDPTANDAT